MSKKKFRKEMSNVANHNRVDVSQSDPLQNIVKIEIATVPSHGSTSFEQQNSGNMIRESEKSNLDDCDAMENNSTNSNNNFLFDEDISENFSDNFSERSLLETKDNIFCVNCKGKVQKILDKVEGLEGKVEKMENLLTLMQSKDLETKKILRLNLGYAKQVSRLMKQLTGEEGIFHDIEKIFPLETITELCNLEERAKEPKFTSTLIKYFRRFQSSEESVDKAFKHIAIDSVYQQFNLNGVAGKGSLMSLDLFKKILYDACGFKIGMIAYQKQLKKSVLKAHNRFFKKKRESNI